MKNHEYRELVNTLTKIAREYGQTQQLRERIAHALPFDCDVIDDAVCDHLRKMGLIDDKNTVAGVHRPMTALDLADEHDAYDDVPQAKEVAAVLRSQAAEIERLKRERHHIYDLLARIHRDGGQYAAEHGVEKACDDAEAQVVTWIETIGGADALIEQARIAEREACAVVCDDLCRMLPGTKSGSMLHFAAKRIRARLAK